MSTPMSRREFLRGSSAAGVSLAFGGVMAACAHTPSGTSTQPNPLAGVTVADAHAHPDRFSSDNSSQPDWSSTLSAIVETGIALSVFATVGDRNFLSRGNPLGTEYESTKEQLSRASRLVDRGKIRPVLRGADVQIPLSTGVPFAVIAIEGGDPLEGDIGRVKEFFDLGVRLITLIHYRNNKLGDVMASFEGKSPGPFSGGLTPAGKSVVEEMQRLGMVVDIAHASEETLRSVCEIAGKPIIDSHTSPKPPEGATPWRRFRSWREMELMAKTGGVVCTWPLRVTGGDFRRQKFPDWAAEIVTMKQRLGMEHVGLGTDGGGGLPALIDRYRGVQDLGLLAAAMLEAGLSREDVGAYMGGNFLRVLGACLA